MKGLRRLLFSGLVVLLFFLAPKPPVATAANRWLLVPVVNCRPEDFRAIFGLGQLVSNPASFDDRWTAKCGDAEVSSTKKHNPCASRPGRPTSDEETAEVK